MKRQSLLLSTVLCSLVLSGVLFAEGIPTRIRVRAVSRDAKTIGSSVGGVLITITDVSTKQILARGLQLGESGDTSKIMGPRERGAVVYDTPGAAVFETSLLLERPTVVEVSAEGPLNFPQAVNRSSKTLLLVPGQDVLGEGILLEIHGFIVKILSPDTDATLGSNLDVKVLLTMT